MVGADRASRGVPRRNSALASFGRRPPRPTPTPEAGDRVLPAGAPRRQGSTRGVRHRSTCEPERAVEAARSKRGAVALRAAGNATGERATCHRGSGRSEFAASSRGPDRGGQRALSGRLGSWLRPSGRSFPSSMTTVRFVLFSCGTWGRDLGGNTRSSLMATRRLPCGPSRSTQLRVVRSRRFSSRTRLPAAAASFALAFVPLTRMRAGSCWSGAASGGTLIRLSRRCELGRQRRTCSSRGCSGSGGCYLPLTELLADWEASQRPRSRWCRSWGGAGETLERIAGRVRRSGSRSASTRRRRRRLRRSSSARSRRLRDCRPSRSAAGRC